MSSDNSSGSGTIVPPHIDNVSVPIPILADAPAGLQQMVNFITALHSAGRLQSLAIVAALDNGGVASMYCEPPTGDRYRLVYGCRQLESRLLTEEV